MDKLTFPPAEYLQALSMLKTGFISSPLPDNLTQDTRTAVFDRISELEYKIQQLLPATKDVMSSPYPMITLIVEDTQD